MCEPVSYVRPLCLCLDCIVPKCTSNTNHLTLVEGSRAHREFNGNFIVRKLKQDVCRQNLTEKQKMISEQPEYFQQ